MRRWIVGRDDRERKGGADRSLNPARIAQSADQPVISLHMRGIGGNDRAEGSRSLRRRPGVEQAEAALKHIAGNGTGISHGYLQDNCLLPPIPSCKPLAVD